VIKPIALAFLVILAIYAYEGLARKVSTLAAQEPSPALARFQKRKIAVAGIGYILKLTILLLTGVMTAISSTVYPLQALIIEISLQQLYYLPAPILTPSRKYFCKRMNNIRGGNSASIDEADWPFQSNTNLPNVLVIPTITG
jgi:hypothetical protein